MQLIKSCEKLIDNNFHALKQKNFRYFWLGQCISLIGTWMQNIGQAWLVLSLTGSPFLLGLIGTFQFLPVMLFSLFAGVVVDRFPKQKIIIITQISSMILAFSLSIMVFTKSTNYWCILVIAILLGITNTIDMPARQAFTVEIAGREDLMNAIALNSAVFNLARIVGPAIGAVLMSIVGAGWCFLLNGLSFIAVLYGLLKIKVQYNSNRTNLQDGFLKGIKEGITYIVENPKIFKTILLVGVMGIFAYNYNVLIPVFTRNVLHQGEKSYGALLSALGIGSLIGAVIVSSRSKKAPNMKSMIVSIIIICIMLICSGMSSEFYVSAVILVVTGIFNINFSARANSGLQIEAKDEYRGRVMSVYSLVFAGSTPLGNLFVGSTSQKFGAKMSFILSGIFALVLVLIILAAFKMFKKGTAKIVKD
ncbi:MAG: MFS transporter [Clostridium sp.]|nr:MFS transporter [Clostridium sp.]